MVDVTQVVDYFLANADRDEGITNLKLQKLCAYAQAFSLALRGQPLFSNAIHAWPHGPVIPEVYNAYRNMGKSPISTAVLPEESRQPFTAEELYVLETVNGYYGRFAAWTLRNMSHDDFPGDFENPLRPEITCVDITSAFERNKVVTAIKTALA